MFRILILQTLYDLSDEDMEFNLCDRLSFQKFVGIGVMDDVPDARTIWKFRQRLGAKGVREPFKEFDRMMKERGLSYSKGTAVDASFQEAKRQRNSKEENAHLKETGEAPKEWSAKKKAHKDIEATWTRKGNEKHYGYKNTRRFREPALQHETPLFLGKCRTTVSCCLEMKEKSTFNRRESV